MEAKNENSNEYRIIRAKKFIKSANKELFITRIWNTLVLTALVTMGLGLFASTAGKFPIIKLFGDAVGVTLQLIGIFGTVFTIAGRIYRNEFFSIKSLKEQINEAKTDILFEEKLISGELDYNKNNLIYADVQGRVREDLLKESKKLKNVIEARKTNKFKITKEEELSL